ncbi:Rho termination factor N-terminal domain-containing protein [Thermosulfuriphilus sp.]
MSEETPKNEEIKKLDKPLEKMTVKELRAIALEIPEITGVHAMNKEELVAAIKEVWGIKDEKAPKAGSMREIKAKIKEYRRLAEEAKAKGDRDLWQRYRRKAIQLKKKTRRMAKAAG